MIGVHEIGGSPQPWAGAHLSSGSLSCSADERGETQHLRRVDLTSLRQESGDDRCGQRPIREKQEQNAPYGGQKAGKSQRVMPEQRKPQMG
jgi:hypothetical protein